MPRLQQELQVRNRRVQALIRAGKPYDLFVLPEMHHDPWNSKTYWKTVGRYFQEHLKP